MKPKTRGIDREGAKMANKAGSFSGRTPDFDSGNRGSSPLPASRMPIPTEEQEQAVVVSWLRYNRILFTHPANEGLHKVQYRAKQARLGMSSGVPDLLIFDVPQHYPNSKGCALEMKRTKGGVLSEAQADWLYKLEERGWHVIIAKGADEAIKALMAAGYGN